MCGYTPSDYSNPPSNVWLDFLHFTTPPTWSIKDRSHWTRHDAGGKRIFCVQFLEKTRLHKWTAVYLVVLVFASGVGGMSMAQAGWAKASHLHPASWCFYFVNMPSGIPQRDHHYDFFYTAVVCKLMKTAQFHVLLSLQQLAPLSSCWMFCIFFKWHFMSLYTNIQLNNNKKNSVGQSPLS